MNEITVLKAIGSTEPSTFREFCLALDGECPDRGDKQEWGRLFGLLRNAERNGLIEIEWDMGMIETIILTESGVARIKQQRRGA